MSDFSKPTKKYVRAAKTEGYDVLAAVDIDKNYANGIGLSAFFNNGAILRYADDKLAEMFLFGYVLCKAGRIPSYAELLEHVEEDLGSAIENLGPNFVDAGNDYLEKIRFIQENRPIDKERTRIAQSKPKDGELS